MRAARLTHRLVFFLLAALVVVAYLPALRGGFVWDDDLYVVHNDQLRSLLGLWNIWRHPAASPQYYPLAFTTYWAEYQLFGLAALPFHLTNVLLHGLNCALLYVVLVRLRVRGAVVAAGIFAVHPLHVESVAWIAERKTLLSATLSFVAVLFWLRFLATQRRTHYAGAVAAAVLAMLAKTTAVTLPGALLLLTWWRAPKLLRAAGRQLVPLVITAAVLAGVTIGREHVYQSPGPLQNLLNGTLIAGHAAAFYGYKLLLPLPLLPIYPRWPVGPMDLLCTAALPTGLVVLWWMQRKAGKGPVVGLGVYLLALLPTLGFVHFDFLRLALAADHFAYPATAALIGLTVGVVASASRRTTVSLPLLGFAVAICGVFCVLTARQCEVYEDELHFWTHAVRYNPTSAEGSIHLAYALVRAGDGEAAERVARTALASNPNDPELHNILGAALQVRGDDAAAEAQFRAALAGPLPSSSAQFNLGRILFEQHRWSEAIEQLEGIPSDGPRRLQVERYMGLAFRNLGDAAHAIPHLQAALRIDPEDQASRAALQQLSPGSRSPD